MSKSNKDSTAKQSQQRDQELEKYKVKNDTEAAKILSPSLSIFYQSRPNQSINQSINQFICLPLDSPIPNSSRLRHTSPIEKYKTSHCKLSGHLDSFYHDIAAAPKRTFPEGTFLSRVNLGFFVFSFSFCLLSSQFAFATCPLRVRSLSRLLVHVQFPPIWVLAKPNYAYPLLGP